MKLRIFSLCTFLVGKPGSPEATTTIEGLQLPPPPQKFEGKIERNAAQSKPAWRNPR
jgi:arylsulfatase